MATMVNPIINHMQVKDSRWLTLEVCREFTRNKCTRTDTECKFAHPPPHVEVQNGRVTCCFDSIKGKCQRKDPPCKYLHPPQHLREQLLQNGKNNLILKNLQMQAMAAGLVPIGAPVGVMPPQSAERDLYGYGTQDVNMLNRMQPTTPYLTVQSPAFSPYIAGPGQFPMQPTGQLTALHGMDGSAASQMNANNQQMSGMMTQTPAMTVTSTKTPRPDRLESGSTSTTVSSAAASEHTSLPGMTWTTAGYVDTLAGPTSHYPSLYLQGMSAVPGVGMPIMKRPAMADKSGIPMYQPGGAAAYQQAALAAMSLQQQPFAPVTIAGHHPSVQRF